MDPQTKARIDGQRTLIATFQSGDGAHCGLADWYPDKEKALTTALEKFSKRGSGFDTGWYSSKKEIASARIYTDAKPPLPGLYVEVSVSDDFDTPGSGGAYVPEATLEGIRKAIYAAWDGAEADQKANRVYTGFKVLTRKKVHSTYHGGDPVGKARLAMVWAETYIRNDSDGLDEPPGDSYPNWGWQGDCQIPKAIRDKLEDYACAYRKGKPASFTVGKWTIEPWEEAE